MAGAKSITCSSCGNPVAIQALGVTVNVACQACGSMLDLVDAQHRVLYVQRQLELFKPRIPLGTRGLLEDKEWECIGFQVREDAKSQFTWEEYLLYNPRFGFRWLVCSDGHWSLVNTQVGNLSQINLNSSTITLKGRQYRQYHRGRARTIFVLGEFYWRLKIGSLTSVTDYISPPFQFSIEQDATEVNGSIGYYLRPKEVQQAFGLAEPPSTTVGVGPTQLNPYEGAQKVPLIGLLLIVALIVYQGILGGFIQNRVSFDSDWITAKDSAGKLEEASFGPIVINNGPINGHLQVLSEVSNNWQDFEITLFNATTQEAQYLYLGTSFYSGVDGGERWTEGSRESSLNLSALPSGEYFITVEGLTDPASPANRYRFLFNTGNTVWGNVILASIILALICAVIYGLYYSFEMNRWSDSDYSPYVSE